MIGLFCPLLENRLCFPIKSGIYKAYTNSLQAAFRPNHKNVRLTEDMR